MKISSRRSSSIVCTIAAAVPLAAAIHLDVEDPNSIKSAASTIAHGLMSYYTGNVTNTPETLAVLPGPYYWWEAGAMWGGMLDYYYYTKDPSYNNVLSQALLSQVGPNFDYMVPRHQKDEGNDDQAFWGFATMAAAERNYEAPPSGIPSWLQMTINLWNTQVYRWDLSSCGGGLRWQIFQFNNGYNYKNSVSNGAFFQLSSRLARYTGNSTYLEWAEKTWNWSVDVGLIDNYKIYDGANDLTNCSEFSRTQWTYNHGIHIYGAAVMYNYTNGSTIWEERLSGLLDVVGIFFRTDVKDVMYEAACEDINTCDTDQWSFKAYLSRYMWATTKLAAFTTDTITTLLSASASAAAQACSGGADGVGCGAKWYVKGWDGSLGVGQQLSALECIQGLLINDTEAPFTSVNVHISSGPSTTPTLTPVPTPTETPKKSRASGHTRKHLRAVWAATLTVAALSQF